MIFLDRFGVNIDISFSTLRHISTFTKRSHDRSTYFAALPLFNHDFIARPGTYDFQSHLNFSVDVEYENAAHVRPRIPRLLAAFASLQRANVPLGLHPFASCRVPPASTATDLRLFER